MSAAVAIADVQYPMLNEMGIARVHEISHYKLKAVSETKDTLKVFYRRAKGSLLPVSRKYTFGRAARTVVVDGGTGRMETITEISPILTAAIAELDSLVQARESAVQELREPRKVSDEKAQLLILLDALEERATAGAADAELESQFDEFRNRLQSLAA